MRQTIILVISLLVTGFQVIGQPKYTKQEEHIKKLIEQSVVDYNEGRYEDFMNYFSDDYVRMKSGFPTYSKKGSAKSQLLQTILQNASSFELKLEIIPLMIKVDKTLAYDRGLFILSFKPKTGGPWKDIKRRYLEVWQKESNQQWKIIEGLDIDYFEQD